MADVLDDREIVRDEQIRHPELVLQIHQQIDDLCLHRHIERGNGFVANDQPRIGCERTRDAEALTLPARELVRILHHLIRAQAHLLE